MQGDESIGHIGSLAIADGQLYISAITIKVTDPIEAMAQNLSLHLRYFAILREQSGRDGETVSTAATTPGELYRALAAQYAFTLPPERVGVAVNDRFAAMDAALRDGDRIVFVPPVAGG